MTLSKISREKLVAEKEIQQEIFDSIDQNENILFSSGAGSGKTYALIESLKYIIKKYGLRLNQHNQKIICITYTNVATEEVKERLGNSDLVEVSTIHEKIWGLIKNYQKELVIIHQTKLEEEIKLLINKLENEQKFVSYQGLTSDQKISFTEIMLSKKDIFYENYDNRAKEIKTVFKDFLITYPDIIKNVSNFKSLVSTIYKIENYTLCLANIKSKKKAYDKVIYNSTSNTDRLYRMRISHDTLLEYGLNIIKKFELLQHIIIDKYPYFLIDEYQDTNKQVIEIMSLLSKRSVAIKHDFFVGYFGDTAQNIYDTGVGQGIKTIHTNLKEINKPFNRRSTKEVIDVINSIRNDEIQQVSIYDDSCGGSVKFHTVDRGEVDKNIDNYIKKWNISVENKLHCFVLTNKSVAEYSGFSKIYLFFSKTKKYKKDYKQLNTELLNDDKSKLGDIPILLFRIIEFRNKLLQSKTPVQEILNPAIYGDMNIKSLREFLFLLKKIKGTTLGEFINAIRQIYNETHNEKYQILINNIFDFEGFPSKSFEAYIIECLYPDLKDEDVKQAKTEISDFLDIELDEFDLWYKYILREIKDKIVYHTYHGTKGLEFDHVIILMENAFGKNKNYFNSYFKQVGSNADIPEKDIKDFEQKKNLLYVACSRSIKNLRVLYLDDTSEFQVGIQKIFPPV